MERIKVYENESYLIEQDLDFGYITHKKKMETRKIRLEDKFLMDLYAEAIHSDTNHIWYDEIFKEVLTEEIEKYHQ